MHATHKFTDWLRSARSASRMAVFLSFSAWQTYQPSSGGAPSACAHLKYTHTHTHTSLLLTQGDACSRNKLNQMSALQISFLIRFSPPLWPLLLFFLITGSPTREWYRTTSNSPSSLHRFIFLAVSSSAVKSQRRRAPLRRTHLAQRSRWLSNRSEAGEQARLASRARLSIVKYVKMMQKAFANPNKKRCIQCIRTQASRQWRPD